MTVGLDIDGNMWWCGCISPLGLISRSITKVFSEIPFKMVSCGISHVIALDIEGNLWGYASGNDGQLCLDDITFCHKLTKISSDTVYFSVDCNGYHTIAVDIEGNLFACGNNMYGQLGMGNLIGQNTLIKVPFGAHITGLSDTNNVTSNMIKGARSNSYRS